MNLTVRRVDLLLAHNWKIARTAGTNVSTVIVVGLTNKNGVMGRGEAAPIARYKESLDTVEAFYRKVDASRLSFADVDGSMRYLDSLSAHDMSAKCGINIALLDGAARIARKPVYDYLGLGFREKQHVTSFTIGIDKPDVFRKKVAQAGQYPVLKVKVGSAEDRANLEALREVSPTKTVRADANEGWKTREEALEMIEWLAKDKHIEYVEQPMPAETPMADWVWLKEKSPLPIFGDESYHTAADADRAKQCFHGVNVKLVKTGGISGGYAALKAARDRGLKTMIGCMIETSILISAAAHLAELCDYMDVDGNILITNDPYVGVSCEQGVLGFESAPEKVGLRVSPRAGGANL